ncbi:MAG: phytanoyl-CoA dioxygenase family protein [Pseudomonadales bacterium]|nr:phytanoyl-CoA dioxygenase family protein [Pseudomonadales bacterium]
MERSTEFGLTEAERRAWAEDGFFLRPAAFAAAEIEALAAAAEAAARTAAAGCARGRSYVLDGKRFVDCDHVTVQFEHAPGSEDVKVIEPVHGFDARLEALLDDPRLTRPVRELLGTDDLSLWTDKLNLKRPGVGSGFGWHQDSPYWIHDHQDVDALPNVMVTFDAADAGNGALGLIRGSHRSGCLPGTADGTQLGGFYTDPASFDLQDRVVAAAPAGSLIFFSPHLVHGSEPNHSDRPRRAMVITYQPGHAPTLKSREIRPVP